MELFSKLPVEKKIEVFNKVFKNKDGEIMYRQRIVDLFKEYGAYIPKTSVSIFDKLEEHGILKRIENPDKRASRRLVVYKIHYIEIGPSNKSVVGKVFQKKSEKYPKRIHLSGLPISIQHVRTIIINNVEYPIYAFPKKTYINDIMGICLKCRKLHNGICILTRHVCTENLEDNEIPIKQEGYYYPKVDDYLSEYSKLSINFMTKTTGIKKTKLFVKSGTATMLLGSFNSKNRAQAAASMIKDTIEAYDGTCEASFLFVN